MGSRPASIYRRAKPPATLGFSPAPAKTLVRWTSLDVSTRLRKEGAYESGIQGSQVSFSGLLQLGISTVIFLLAATAAKQWGLAPSLGKIVLTLAL